MDHFTAAPAGVGRAEHAEGPAWDARYERLMWVDQFAGLVHSASFEGGVLTVERTFEIGAPAGAVVPMRGDDGWLVAAGPGFSHLAFDGMVTALAGDMDTAVLRMNDGKVDPAGRFWAGNMAWDATPGAACFYRLEPDFTITKALDDLTISNGLSWTPDGATMFFIDSPTQRVDRFAVSASGELTRVGTAADIPVSHGTPDGMTIDDEGCLWVALWGGNAVQRYSPSGELLARVEVDAPQVSSCAFGGPDRSTLFITTSQEGYGPADSAAHPFAGELFTIHLDVTGPVAAECSRDYALSRA